VSAYPHCLHVLPDHDLHRHHHVLHQYRLVVVVAIVVAAIVVAAIVVAAVVAAAVAVAAVATAAAAVVVLIPIFTHPLSVAIHKTTHQQVLQHFAQKAVEQCRGFVNRSAIEVGVWRFVEGGEQGGAIQDRGSTSLPSFRSCNGGETLRAAIIYYMATSARLQ
jgi:hypothetical protein